MASGDTKGEETVVVGIDAGSRCFSYIRSGSPLKYDLALPIEHMVHITCETVDQIQVQGMNPGDEGCMIGYSGQQVYAEPMLITPENCPEVGTPIHEVFDYYGGDPEDTDAWYYWNDGPGIYTVEDYDISGGI